MLSEDCKLDDKNKTFLRTHKPQEYAHNSFYVLVPDKSQVKYPDSFQAVASIDLNGESLKYSVEVDIQDTRVTEEEENITLFVTYNLPNNV